MLKKFLRSIYQLIPFKKNIFLLVRRIMRPGEAIFKHLHFKGDFTVKADEEHSFKLFSKGFQLENEIFWGGLYYRYEKKSLEVWRELSKRSEVILDVGANSGIFSLLSNAVNPTARVYAFEPIERVFELLSHNIRLNKAEIIPVKKALSDNSGRHLVFDILASTEYTVSLSRNTFTDSDDVIQVEIESQRLDEYILQNRISKIDLMKIDVEYHEVEVLKGMGKFLAAFKPTMIIEIVEPELAEGIEAMVKDLGYLYFDIDESNGLIQRKKIEKSSAYNYLLCSEQTAKSISLIK